MALGASTKTVIDAVSPYSELAGLSVFSAARKPLFLAQSTQERQQTSALAKVASVLSTAKRLRTVCLSNTRKVRSALSFQSVTNVRRFRNFLNRHAVAPKTYRLRARIVKLRLPVMPGHTRILHTFPKAFKL